MADLDLKGLGEHLPIISTAVVSLVVIVGTVMKGYSWLTESWKSSLRDELRGLIKDIERMEKRLDKLEERIEGNGHGRDGSVRGQRANFPD